MPSTSQSLKCNLRPLLCGIVALVLVAPACLAQHYTFSEAAPGMDNLNVDCIAQDNSGFLWVGTENGLYRYD